MGKIDRKGLSNGSPTVYLKKDYFKTDRRESIDFRQSKIGNSIFIGSNANGQKTNRDGGSKKPSKKNFLFLQSGFMKEIEEFGKKGEIKLIDFRKVLPFYALIHVAINGIDLGF